MLGFWHPPSNEPTLGAEGGAESWCPHPQPLSLVGGLRALVWEPELRLSPVWTSDESLPL